jgi:phosphoglycerate dehydrogenase-like enzyme
MSDSRQSISKGRLSGAILGCGWIGTGIAKDLATVGMQSHAEAMVAHQEIDLRRGGRL